MIQFIKNILGLKKREVKFGNLCEYCRGWYVGDFEPSIHRTGFEVAYHIYDEGEESEEHYHKLADEINLVTDGACQVLSNGIWYTLNKGDIWMVPKKHPTKFRSLRPKTRIVVIKTKSVKGDKYNV